MITLDTQIVEMRHLTLFMTLFTRCRKLHQHRVPESHPAHQRFIRWVRFWIYKQAPWGDSIARLKEVWGGIYS